jgi:RHS repeat-associated protein
VFKSSNYQGWSSSEVPTPNTQGAEPTAGTGSAGANSIPAISLPKGGGAIRGIGEKFAANPVNGTAGLTVPIATSPGRSGFGPQLNLSYDSGAGNGPFGFGWSLSLPAITRKTDKGLPQYRDGEESDVFILSGSEDLVPVLVEANGKWQRETLPTRILDGRSYRVQRYRPRIEGLFARVERWTDLQTGETHWRSITRDNLTTLYGKDDNSRIFAPADASQPKREFSWLICQSYDDKGNAIVYEYASENNQNVDLTQANERNRTHTTNRYLKRIKYGNKVSRLVQPDFSKLDWMFEVVFDYEEGHHESVPLDPLLTEAEQHRFVRAAAAVATPWAVRPDPFSSYRSGFEVRTYRRCQRVLMFHHFVELAAEPYLVRSTEFEYADFDYSKTTAIEQQLAYHGSSRFGSFIRSTTQSGFVRDDAQAVVTRSGVEYVTYLKKSLPPIEFEYSQANIQEDIRELDEASLKNLPVGLDGSTYHWVDLDGEGISGILTDQADAWFYKPNLGDGHFGPLEVVASKPSLANLDGASQQLIDLAGDGQLDLVIFGAPSPGFYERTQDEGWARFQAFRYLPNIRWDDPNLRFIDLTGDGHADILITEDEVLTWYPSLAEEGFEAARYVRKPFDEERGPRLVLADGTQSIYLADMCGDGLTALVRIRNGEVCYWPNLGYGRFGAKVTMDDAPRFDNPDQFDNRRIRLADIDGSGTNDIIYLARDGVRLYFNQSGNRWTEARSLCQFPQVDNLSSIMTADLLGNGTACLVWSSPLPASKRRPLRYIDLMGGQKPHLLISRINNLGAETHVSYTSSTKFYLADKLAGTPWITKLPFPVHVVEHVETFDRISGNRFVTRYDYHHGYFDGVEREFRGFGMVEQRDTEEFAALSTSRQSPVGTNIDESSHVPPVLTRTWFHTGVFLGRNRVSNFFAGLVDQADAGEYYREPGLTDAQAKELLLDDTMLPAALTIEEEREACRALKGSMLRQEVYGLDGTAKETHPYLVTEQNFTIRRIQPQGDNRHAVFFTHAGESLTYQYERNPADPRIAHALTLEVDDFGNVLKSAAINYGRRQDIRVVDGFGGTINVPNPGLAQLSGADQAKQTTTLITYSENHFTNRIADDDNYRVPIACESRTYELTGLTPSAGSSRFAPSELLNGGMGAATIPYEQTPTPGIQQRRIVKHERTLFRRNDLAGPLPLCQVESLALPFENYKLAFTAGLLTMVYQGRVNDSMLSSEGGYVHSESDADWWIPSGRAFYSANPTDTAAQELVQAHAHFFIPRRYRDPFHTNAVSTETFVTYDAYDLQMEETRDAMGNRVTVGERDAAGNILTAAHDYRLLRPRAVMGPNRNRTAVAFDALGMVAGTALMGKPDDVPLLGDSLPATFKTNLTQAEIDQFVANPKGPMAALLLDQATTRIVYDLTSYWRQPLPLLKPPVFAATLARETHVSDSTPQGGLKIQVSFSYSDGFEREIQKKIQAEAGPVPQRDVNGKIIVGPDGQPVSTPNDVSPRWVGNGWTVFNNKGKPVQQYEPFFTDTHRFEFDARIGVSPVIFYDPAERVAATLHPNHTWEKAIFLAWQQETWDSNDTVLLNPKTDPDIGDFARRLPDAAYLPTWYDQRQGGALGSQEQTAARKAAIHNATPTLAHIDTLARLFLTVAHNKFKRSNTPPADPPTEEFYFTRTQFDIEGNQRAVVDPNDRVVMRYDYDVLGNRIHQSSMETGDRWSLHDVAGKPIRSSDSRDHAFRTVYNQLRLPVETYLSEAGGPELQIERTIYGEALLNPEANNLRGKIVQRFDQAGVVKSDNYDFKGNLLRSQRQFAVAYKTTLDWSAAVPLEGETHDFLDRYDALNRTTQVTTPDNSVVRKFFNEANLLERVEANLRGEQQNGQLVWTPFVSDIDYNARGQHTLMDYGNGVRTICDYDVFTFRLVKQISRRNAVDFPNDCPAPSPVDWPGCQVQTLSYTYDPTGNIVIIRDDAQQTIYFANRRVEPTAEYTYDASYRLIEATGREHLGQTSNQPNAPTAPDAFNGFHTRLDDPGDGNAMGTYFEQYVYDAVDNILSVQHRGTLPSNSGWTRSYVYAESSQLEIGKVNNRLSRTTLGAITENYRYDGSAGLHGNMTAMPHLPLMQWDYRDQLQATAQQVVTSGTPETTWYVYDARGHRVRKVTERQAAAGQTPTRMKERIYLEGCFEIYREYKNDGATVKLQRETLPIKDAKQPVALVETRTDTITPEQLVRYQLTNHLGSAVLELDQQAQIISYEEYYPFGSTSYQAVRSQLETSKRYRYTGKERDEESGLYYFGARYYAPHICRWIAFDPIGIGKSLNGYSYVRNRPLAFVDPDGRQDAPADDAGTVGRPGFGESLIPIWGSGRDAVYNFQTGHWGWGLAYTGLAITDVFLVKSIATAIGKGIFKSVGLAEAKALAAKQAAKELAAKEAAKELAAKTAAKELAAKEAAKELAAKEAAKQLAAKEAAKELAAKESAKELAAKEGVGAAAKEGENYVYRSVDAAGKVQYVGITNDLARRAAEHLAEKGIKIGPLFEHLSRADARAVEQALIEIHGLGKKGGTLLNKINSIAKSNFAYAEQVKRGYELLKSIGYK